MATLKITSHKALPILFCIGMLFCIPTHAKKEKKAEIAAVNIETTVTAVSAAELTIAEKRVSKSCSWNVKLLSPTTLEQRKHNLTVDLCREVNADVLVDPQFTYEKRILGGGRLTVSGYPAVYKNFRAMSDKEVDAFISTPEYQSGKVVFINK